ncbi:unknown [Eggerthella sp. CAG:368]|nr:unknown [Eggerthella sp. CAG:368]
MRTLLLLAKGVVHLYRFIHHFNSFYRCDAERESSIIEPMSVPEASRLKSFATNLGGNAE